LIKHKIISSLFNEEKKHFAGRLKEIILGTGNHSSKSILVSAIFDEKKIEKKILVINFKGEAESFKKHLEFWTKQKIEIVDFENDTETEKNAKIIKIIKSKNLNKIFLIDKKSFFHKFVNKKIFDLSTLEIKENDKMTFFDIFDYLIENGYKVNEKEKMLKMGEYKKVDSVLQINVPIFGLMKLSIKEGKVQKIVGEENEISKIKIFPLKFKDEKNNWISFLKENDKVIFDEIDFEENPEMSLQKTKFTKNFFQSIPDDKKDFIHFRFLSCLRYYSAPEMVYDIREKIAQNWKILCITRKKNKLEKIFQEEKIPYEKIKEKIKEHGVSVLDAKDLEFSPASFQNTNKKIAVLSDKEIFYKKKSQDTEITKNVAMEFVSSLKIGDYIIHENHGIGRFVGIEKKMVGDYNREYLKIEYAENDALFVPIEQADKISKYIGDIENPPTLMRLGESKWKNMKKKAKVVAEKVAKELLKIFTKRKIAKKDKPCKAETKKEKEFAKTFPYEETPGQTRAINDVRRDMESKKPMDRLVCGDVGFGKTEVALRASFKAVQNKKQVALISPITILTKQHFDTFQKRMESFDVKIDMISRFKTQKEQKEIIKKLEQGELDIVIGTHRLMQEDIKFKNLGLLILDEEQKFGVKQKENIKKIKANVDMLTLTATPIPRTLNMALGKLKEITMITTPPPGRLPVITEVRKHSQNIIKEIISQELKRNGQIYFLHNRVKDIESIADKLRSLVKEAKIIVAHGQLDSQDLSKRITEFKNKKYDVLVSSTIIENGIDLANANTLIVNNADNFGLSQLYQLRGRVGRSKKQAYAYFLHNKQKLTIEAKKRLRAIMEASELGSGFQIAMRDLEIRGAGDILGVSQHGAINSVGVGHFLKILSNAIDESKKINKTGNKTEIEEEEEEEIIIDIPLQSFIPEKFITEIKEKILLYQKIARALNEKELEEIKEDISTKFGPLPQEVQNLLFTTRLKIQSKIAGILQIRMWYNSKEDKGEIMITISNNVTPAHIMNLLNKQKTWKISGNKLKLRFKKLSLGWTEKLMKVVKILQKAYTK